MNTSQAVKLHNSLRALAIVVGSENLSHIRVQSVGWGKRTQIENMTKQQIKLAVALSDTSPATIKNSLTYRKEFNRAKNLEKFILSVCVPDTTIDPVSTGLALLN